MASLDYSSLTLWITAATVKHLRDLAAAVAQRAGVTRLTARKAIKRLVEMC